MLGPVFRTHDPDQDRLVAVKAFTLDLTPEQATALAAEFERIAALGLAAPSLAAPIAAGVEEFVPYVAVPHVSGESLDAAVRQYGPAPAGDAIRLIAHVADALDAAAAAGVHHGSLHPRDIIVTPGETHVTGIGVAQALDRVGLHGPVRRPYVAPEREGGDEWSAPADIYALAAIAYEVLTGRRALPGTDQPLPGLNDLRVHDAAALRDVIESALDPDPSRRPARARDFASGFAAALSASAAGAIGERAPDRRARRPRTRPPKLPGLDEPLMAEDAAARPRARAAVQISPVPVVRTPPVDEAAPAPPPVEAPAPVLAESLVEAAPPPSEGIRYVPVSDPADAGDAAPGPPLVPPVVEDRAPDSTAPPREAVETPVPLEPSARLASGLTPDLRLADELMSRADASGESIDADLAAALDQLAPGAGSTPAALNASIFGEEPLARALGPDLARAGAGLDLAAEIRLGDQGLVGADATGPLAGTTASTTIQQAAAELPSELGAFVPQITPTGMGEAPGLDVGAADRSPLVEEPVVPAPTPPSPRTPEPSADTPRPFARGRSPERRRPSPRFGRLDALPPAPASVGAPDTGVPRAFEEGRPTPLPRLVPDFELLTRPEPARLPLLPVLVGVVGGLILGLAGGYWLGSRSVPPPGGPPQAAARTAPPSSPAQVPGAAPAAAPAGTTPAAQSVPEPGAAPVTQAAPTPPSAPAPAALPPAASTVRGSIMVTASQQANVFLDGQRQGMTPRNLRNVPLGRHTIRVTRPGYATQEQAVVITAEEPTASLDFTLRRSDAAAPAGAAQAPAVRSVLVVVVESNPPGARIRIDGRDLAPAPLTVRQLRPGTHTLELRLAGYKTWTQRITVAAGDNRRIVATLERDTPR